MKLYSVVFRAACGVPLVLTTSCATRDTRHHVVISVPEQRLACGTRRASRDVSSFDFEVRDRRFTGSRGTPLGELEVAQKIGGGAPLGAVFKSPRRTGEILPPDAPGRDPS